MVKVVMLLVVVILLLLSLLMLMMEVVVGLVMLIAVMLSVVVNILLLVVKLMPLKVASIPRAKSLKCSMFMSPLYTSSAVSSGIGLVLLLFLTVEGQ